MSAPAVGSALEVLERLLRQAREAARDAQGEAGDFFQAEELGEVQVDLDRILAVLKERRGDYS